MADKYVKTKEVADKYFDGLGKEGSYQESTGGGHPFEKGDSNTRTTRANGKVRQIENDTDQPRTEDGKFTYNAVNGKDVKYGGRGKTVPPTLTGGKNGVYLDKEHAKDKKGNDLEDVELAEDFYKDMDYVPFKKGEKIAFNGKVRTLVLNQFDIARGYEGAKFYQGDEKETFVKAISFGENDFDPTKYPELAEKYNGKTLFINGKQYERIAERIDDSYEQLFKEGTVSRGAGRYSKEEKEASKSSKKESSAQGVASKDPFETRARDTKYMEREAAKAKAKEEEEEKKKKDAATKLEAKKVKKEYKERARKFSEKDERKFKEQYFRFLVEKRGEKESDARRVVNEMPADKLEYLMEKTFKPNIKKNLGLTD